MAEFESERLSIYEEWIDTLPERMDLSHGDYVFPSFTQTAAVEDGYREADFVVEITVSNDVERTLILMASTIDDEDTRQIIGSLEDEDAIDRARKYGSEIESGSYYGVTDGEKVYISSLDPDIQIDESRPIDELPAIIGSIIHEERRIKDSREFIDDLREFHDEVEPYIAEALRSKIANESEYEEQIREFLAPIGMGYEEDEDIPADTIDMLSRQATYLLVDKILFYYLIRENEDSLKKSLENTGKYDEVFEQLKDEPPTPQGVDAEWAAEFWSYLDNIFNLIQEIDYEPIFDPAKSPLNALTLDDHPAACFSLKELMDYLYGKDELSNLFDGPLLAKIYEGLIPPDLRWKWGQIYTPPEITRLITDWTIQNPDSKVLDPACGTGRFLVSSYRRLADLRGVDIGDQHQEIVNQIHGIDINQFPAHLATMSIVAMSLESITEKVNIDVRDFFLFKGGEQTDFAPDSSRIRLGGQTEFADGGGIEGQGRFSFDKPIGKVDSIVMNPPYTRQEALEEEYKEAVREVALSGLGENGDELKMSKRAGFYTYFMTHGTKFLKEKGRFGMIIQNSWLDVNYGKDIQKFLLDNYKIRAIIGTKGSRLIRTADVNTVIVLLERESNKEERNNNEVKFVQLKQNVEWFEENYGFDQLIDIIEEQDDHADEDIRVLSKTQESLKEEGMGKTTYTGGKWGKYIRAPDIYFDILEEYDGRLQALEDIAQVRRGTRSGANEFFYLPNKHFDLETDDDQLLVKPKDSEEIKFTIPRQYWMHKVGEEWVPNYLLKTSKEFESIIFSEDNLNLGSTLRYVLIIDTPRNELEDEIEEYIEWGETHDTSECDKCRRDSPLPNSTDDRGRGWYDITPALERGDILPMKNIDIRPYYWVPKISAWIDDRLHGITVSGSEEDRLALAGLLNSTYGALNVEVNGRVNLGQGALDIAADDHRMLMLPNITQMGSNLTSKIADSFEEMGNRPIDTIFEEIGAEEPEEVSLDRVKEDRRQLDKIVMEEVFDLSKKKQLEVYRGLISLVRDRMDKAQG